ncbi:MAG: phospho-N-acetylmuramoyl-pentapeptide-transferase [Christensenellales bacterium]
MEKIFLCIIVGFIISLLISPLVIKFFKKLKANQTIYEYVDMHKQKANTPTMGGVIFIVGSVVAFFCVKQGSFNLALVCIVCFLSFGIIGFLDDFLKIKLKRNLGLKPYQKIIGQVAISVIIAVFAYLNSNIGSSIYLPFSTQTVDLGWFYIPFCVFVFLAITNSVNLTDGLDGLAGGVSLSFLFGFVFIEYIILKSLPIYDATILAEEQNILILCGGVMGSLLCYLLFNSFPAKIFMGDTGSLALGGLIASICISTKQVLLIPILGVMFVVSCVSVILQVAYYKLRKKRIFLMAPYHHHLEKKGLHESKIVVIYIVITIMISVAGILTTLLINA